jgi:hypothetical protein
VQRSWQQGRLAQLEHPWAVKARDMVMRLIPPRLLVKQMEWIVDDRLS